MRKKIPFLALSLFAISCGGGGGSAVTENNGGGVPKDIKVERVCREVCKDVNVDLNISYLGTLKNGKYEVNWGGLKFSYGGRDYYFNLCGFVWKGHQKDTPTPYEKCFLVELEDTDNYCGEPKKIVLYDKGKKVGEINDGLADTYCSSVGAIHEHNFSGITINNFCHTECSEAETSLPVLSKNGGLKVSVKFPHKVSNRAIHGDTDFIRIDVSSELCPPPSGCERYDLEPVYLTRDNPSATLKVPAGWVDILITLWDNNTDIPYPIGGRYIYTRIKEGETKKIVAYIPTGIWKLNSTIKGIKRIQVGTFPTNPEVEWGSPIPEYLIFDKNWYNQATSSNGTFERWEIIGLLDRAFIETDNKTLYGFFIPKWNIEEFLSENKTGENYDEFTFEVWDKFEGTKPDLVFGKFENSTKVSIYAYDYANCTVKFHYENGTVYTFNPWNCLYYLPLSVFSQTGNINGTYIYDNITAYTLKNCDCLIPEEECINMPSDCVKVNKIEINYSFQGVEKAEATVTDLPLPWKDMARITNFNATCTTDGFKCTYYWSINNPKNHSISCYLTDEMGNLKKEVDCSVGNFTCTSNTCPWDMQSISFVVKDNSYVMPLADVASLKEINYITENKEVLKDIPGLSVQLSDVVDILKQSSNGTVTIFKDSPISCLIQEGDKYTSFVLSNCTDSSGDGTFEVTDNSDGTQVSIVWNNETMPVVFAYKYYDRDIIVANYNNKTVAIVGNLANATYYDNELKYIVNGTWKIFTYDNEYFAWVQLNKECISFNSENNTYVYSTDALLKEGNYTISKGTLYMYGDINANNTIVQVFFDPNLLIISNGVETKILKKDENNECH